ncbi:MAG: hypothetical protein WC805_03400 [Patescibacteria group bacterium]
MTEKKPDLTIEECEQIVHLYKQMLACKNQREGERLADEIDKIIKPVTFISLDLINRSISQMGDLPLMMKHLRVLPPPDDKYYLVDRTQIGAYPHSNNRMSPIRKKKEEIHAC